MRNDDETKMNSTVTYRNKGGNFQNEEINSGNIFLRKGHKYNISLKCAVE